MKQVNLEILELTSHFFIFDDIKELIGLFFYVGVIVFLIVLTFYKTHSKNFYDGNHMISGVCL